LFASSAVVDNGVAVSIVVDNVAALFNVVSVLLLLLWWLLLLFIYQMSYI